jgi:CubicO group peptidase (beta-lactamase class C family)
VQLAITRGGRTAHYAARGSRDIEAGRPIEEDTLVRIYSMTEPITSVAALMLVERGRLDLDDPASNYITAFSALRVWGGRNRR